ncbi:YhgE/Pip domain-containing protein [Virgibacillus siamensis]|uniref:YhgE/Pip domain-containing protein n=1 Tax=Virgibacillus siamensis TaxID=480071 RepID=UPI0009849D6A|nr:YhgE/Pip domain-containing protein [Virgibacillus siamensis]
MKKSWNIFSTDMRNISKNWVAAILIGGLILLPSLYAWFNIKASWDPYGQTDQIPIGVVNEDDGATVRDEKINVGDELVKELKKNDSLEWHFNNRKKAMKKVRYGDYFAVIVIPKDFSEHLATVISDHPKKANVEYYVNEKINAIAPKITDKGASVIVEQISSNFVSTVNGVIFDMFNELGLQLEKNLPDIKKFENYVFKLEKDLPEIHQLMTESLDDAKNAQSIINKAQMMIPNAKQVTDNGLQTINDTAAMLSDAKKRLNDLSPKIEADLKKAQKTADDINRFIQEVQNIPIDFSNGEQLKQALDERVNHANEQVTTVKQTLQKLKEMNNEKPSENTGRQNEVINQAIRDLETIQEVLGETQGNVNSIGNFIKGKKQEVTKILANLEDLSANTSNRIGDFLKDYNENIEPAVKEKITSARSTLTNAKSILTGIQSTIPEIENILGRTEGNLQEGEDILNYMLNEYPYVYDKVNQLADKIRKIQGKTDINKIIDLLLNDPKAEQGFFAEPVTLTKNELFPIPNYGSGMTPFYTVLAIWVGALLLISLLAADVHSDNPFTSRQIYFGKLFTFALIGFLQTLIVTLGDIFLIHVYVVHPVWFVLFGLFISLVFMLIVYTLVSLFGDVGKAMAIILLVLQIAGAGGTYPVVLLPEFFQAINPFLPFTYAIDLMREAVGGIVWSRVYNDLIFLSLFGLAFLLIGAFLKGPVNAKKDKLMKKSKESGLFH